MFRFVRPVPLLPSRAPTAQMPCRLRKRFRTTIGARRLRNTILCAPDFLPGDTTRMALLVLHLRAFVDEAFPYSTAWLCPRAPIICALQCPLCLPSDLWEILLL
jgi:hypothetical protein